MAPEMPPPLGDLSAAEAAVEAWSNCEPAADCSLPEGRLLTLLPAIASYVPGGYGSSEKARFFARPATCDASGVNALRLYSDCTPCRQGNTSFLQSIQSHKGKVYFPYFWRAFSEGVRVTAQPRGPGANARLRHAEDVGGLATELEVLRDKVLNLLEDSSSSTGARGFLTKSAFVSAVQGIAATSVVPDFWKPVERCIDSRGPQGRAAELSLEEVSTITLVYLKGALSLQADRNAELRRQVLGKVRPTAEPEDKQPIDHPRPTVKDAEEGFAVHLNIYDVSKTRGVQTFNSVLAHWLSPVKLGGAFHAGVEVCGAEFSYGATRRETLPGLICDQPRQNRNHNFRQTVYIGQTTCSEEMINSIISDLWEEYPGSAYNVLRRNCCHFADEFCHRLGVGAIPPWVHRLARLGAGTDDVMQTVTGIVPAQWVELGALSSFATIAGWEFPADCSKEWPPSCLVSAEPVKCGGKDVTCPGPL